MFPVLICMLMIVFQTVVNSQLNNSKYQCGCQCVDTNGSSTCQNICGLEYSTPTQAMACPVSRPMEWPALLQIPGSQYRSVQTDGHLFTGLPDKHCLETHSCPVTSLFTGQNKPIAESLVQKLVVDEFPQNAADLSDIVSLSYIGTDRNPGRTNFVEQAFLSESPLDVLLPRCVANVSFMVSGTVGSAPFQREIDCVESLYVWRDNSSSINKELHQGYRRGNPANAIHEILGAYDFLNSNESNYNVSFWYNSTYRNVATKPRLLRIPRSLNMVSNAFLRHFKDGSLRILLGFVKEMPKPGTKIALDSSYIGPLLFAWVIQLLFVVFLTCLVYEKQHKLRIMMKMHGLGDGPYWLISYGYFFIISSIYMIWFAVSGSIIRLDLFRLNNYVIQFIFYFVYLNLQITLAFLAAAVFSQVKNATVVGSMYVFGSGLLGAFFFQSYIEDTTFSRLRLMTMELLPGFSLYRGLYELFQSALAGHYQGTSGISWENLNDESNGMKGTLIIMSSEWLILLFFAYYLDQVISAGRGVRKHPLFFLGDFRKRSKKLFKILSIRHRATIFVDLESPAIDDEGYRVETLLTEESKSYPIVCHNLKKVYLGEDGNSKMHAVQSLSLAVSLGECFGLLGPNGSGKTTFLNMVTGFLPPTSGTALIDGMDIRSNMNQIYTRIGVCPQHDLIWENLTGREHLLFYGRLRNLKGAALIQAVDESLKSLNLHEGNVGDKLAGKYSGGMKRRLSVAIALIGDTQVVFMDEPTTGLDPESRNNLWQAVKMAKANRAVILTTHSMEEAEFLCDRVGIMVGGSLQCIGSSKELKTRYGGSYVLTISTNPNHEKDVEDMAIKNFKRHVRIDAFGLTDATLEDIFTKVVHDTS
ncbi:ABC transporter A family member 7-like isoform X2 [Magnolia sinica]|uniref:ABC transporter A family member 7-like isoform X2 n=1 Tax=Magnolia sinica TaxID=86752 RepID=UPI00265B338A|nr:ABC transporter A family member 7-like isoform X2 [Magnolia sinica]